MVNQTTPARFYSNTIQQGECLIWQGRGRIGEYGVAGFKSTHWLAHRLSYYFDTGETPPVVMHTCDTPLCVEPRHLVAGTHAKNVEDKVLKGRHLRKEGHPMSKLTQTQVDHIRESVSQGEQQKSVAKRFGMSTAQLSRIIHNQRWRA